VTRSKSGQVPRTPFLKHCLFTDYVVDRLKLQKPDKPSDGSSTGFRALVDSAFEDLHQGTYS